MNLAQQHAQTVYGMSIAFDHDNEGASRVSNLYDIEKMGNHPDGMRIPLYLPNTTPAQEVAGRFLMLGIDRDVILMKPYIPVTLWEGSGYSDIEELLLGGNMGVIYFSMMMRMDLTVESQLDPLENAYRIRMVFVPRSPSTVGYSHGSI